MIVSDTPDIADVIADAIDSRLLDVHTMVPAKVETYDAAKQVADVTPMIKRVLRTVSGGRVAEDLPTIPCVPVSQLRAGVFFVNVPVSAGTTGMLVFAETSIDRWRATGERVDPADARRHGLSGAVFVPGLAPSADALADASATDMRMGIDGGARIDIAADGTISIGAPNASDHIALGDTLKTYVDALVAWVEAHTHTAPVGGGLTTPPTALPSPTVPILSSKHKVEP